LDGGVGRFLDAVAEARGRNPRVLLIAGVEVVPHYYWTGSPLALEMTAHNTQKNLLVFGLAGAPLESLPVAGNAAAGGFAWTAALDLVPGLLLIPGALLLMQKRRAVQRVGHAVVVVRRRRWLGGGGWDQLLRQYAAGERSRPAWAVGESGFHGVSAGKSIGPVQTVFLVSERTERAVLDAMKRGRMYALFRGADPALALAEFSVTDGVRNAVSGETLTTREGSLLEVRVGIDAVDGAARAVR